MKTIKNTLLMMVIATVLVAPAGCKKSENGEGSAEQAGRKIDNALQKAGQETGNLIEQLRESMQKAGENMQDKTKE